MIFYIETKNGRKSIYAKVVTDNDGNELSRREVEIPLFTITKDNKEYFVLYDDDMNVLSLPSNYLNYQMDNHSLNTKKISANALRLLYVFLSLSNKDINILKKEDINELIRFLQGLNSNPEIYKTVTFRSNDTVNNYLGVYRNFFKSQKVKCDALFDYIKIINQTNFNNDFSQTTERIKYKTNLKTSSSTNTVPKYISPNEFNILYKKATENKDKLAMCIMRLMYCYGLRLGEVLGLTIEDIKEVKRDNILVPMLILRNRLSDRSDQFVKNLGHIDKISTYKSREYNKAKSTFSISGR